MSQIFNFVSPKIQEKLIKSLSVEPSLVLLIHYTTRPTPCQENSYLVYYELALLSIQGEAWTSPCTARTLYILFSEFSLLLLRLS